MTINDTDKKTRSDWAEELSLACDRYAEKTGKTVSAFAMIHPPKPGIVVRVGDALPFNFANTKEATTRVLAWVQAP